MRPVYVAVGSNIDAPRNVRRALEELRASFPDLRASPAYRNAAVGFEGEDFINLVVGFQTDRSLAEVSTELRRIEGVCGRPRAAPKWAPRAMDLDILLYGEEVGQFPEGTLPRPDLLKRPYMLGPLADIAPDHLHPTERRTIGEIWSRFDRGAHRLHVVSL